MKLHKVNKIFEEHKWLRGTVRDGVEIKGGRDQTFEDWVEQVLFGICFRPFAKLNMEAKPSLDTDILNFGDKEGCETTHLRVEYIVACNIDGRVTENFAVGTPPAPPDDTVGKTLVRITNQTRQCYPEKRVRYLAVVRKKSFESPFGATCGYDVFLFPEKWQPPTAS